MTSDLMPRLAGARTWNDDEPLECVSVVPDGPEPSPSLFARLRVPGSITAPGNS